MADGGGVHRSGGKKGGRFGKMGGKMGGFGAGPVKPSSLLSDSSQFSSTCSSLPLVLGRSNSGVDLPSCVKSIPNFMFNTAHSACAFAAG